MDIGRLAQIISKVFSGDSLVASKDRAPQTSRLRLEALETRELLDASSLFQAPTIESTRSSIRSPSSTTQSLKAESTARLQSTRRNNSNSKAPSL